MRKMIATIALAAGLVSAPVMAQTYSYNESGTDQLMSGLILGTILGTVLADQNDDVYVYNRGYYRPRYDHYDRHYHQVDRARREAYRRSHDRYGDGHRR